MSAKLGLTLVLLASLMVFPMIAGAQADRGVGEAVSWLRSIQQADGGFSNGFSEGSDVGATADVILAAIAAGEDPATWKAEGGNPVDFLASAVTGQKVEGAGLTAKVVLAVKAAGFDPRAFAGADLVALIAEGYSQEANLFGMGPFDTSLAILALVSANEPLPPDALEGLLGLRLADGSYAFDGNMTPGAGDSNTTSLVVQALIAAGRADEVQPSLEYFRSVQNEDKGWTYQKPSAFGEATDANSTALVIQALLAAGEELAEWGDPTTALRSLQLPSGGFMYNAATPGENVLATVQAIPALAGVDFTEMASQQFRVASTPSLIGNLTIVSLAVIIAVLIGAGLIGRRLK